MDCKNNPLWSILRIGPLHDSVTWYKITHASEHGAQWDFQNNEFKGLTRTPSQGCFQDFISPECDRHLEGKGR